MDRLRREGGGLCPNMKANAGKLIAKQTSLRPCVSASTVTPIESMNVVCLWQSGQHYTRREPHLPLAGREITDESEEGSSLHMWRQKSSEKYHTLLLTLQSPLSELPLRSFDVNVVKIVSNIVKFCFQVMATQPCRTHKGPLFIVVFLFSPLAWHFYSINLGEKIVL